MSEPELGPSQNFSQSAQSAGKSIALSKTSPSPASQQVVEVARKSIPSNQESLLLSKEGAALPPVAVMSPHSPRGHTIEQLGFLLSKAPRDLAMQRELLSELHQLCQSKAIEHLMPVAADLPEDALGKLLFIADHDPKALMQKLSEDEDPPLVIWIERRFIRHMEHVFAQLMEKHAHADLSTSNQILKEAVKMLIISTGALNGGLIRLMIESFAHHPLMLKPHAKRMEENLLALQNSRRLREKLRSIRPPATPISPAADLIRTTLGLSAPTPIGVVETHQTALLGLISHLRQDAHSDSCFATHIAIKVHSQHPERCLEDFASLLERGYLTRKIENRPVHFPFLSKPDLSLHKAWEYAIAGMGENPVNGRMKRDIISSIQRSIIPLIKKSHLNQDMVLADIERRLLNEVHPLYDPQKGFVLYTRTKENDPRAWKRIDSASLLMDYAAFTVAHAPGFQADKAQIIKAMKTADYAASVLNAYRLAQGAPAAPLKDQNRLKHTPWITRTGGNAKKMWDVYTERPASHGESIFKPVHAEDLLLQLVMHFKSSPPSQHRLSARVVSVHAFSLLPEHPSLTHVWRENQKPRDWIHEHIRLPGLEVANGKISDQMRRQLIAYTAKYHVSERDRPAFLQRCKKESESESIREFREKLIDAVKDPRNAEMVGLRIDSLIYQALPAPSRRMLEQSAIHIADTNWASPNHAHDVHFCILTNPGTAALELWLANDDNSQHAPLQQSRWIKGQSWQIFDQS